MEQRQPNGKKGKSSRTLYIMAAIMLVCAIGVMGVYLDTFYGSGKIRAWISSWSQSNTAQQTSVMNTTPVLPLDHTGGTTVLPLDKYFLVCTKDGVKMYESVNNLIWNDTFTMTTPTAIQEEDYAAVGDMSGRVVRVYNTNGLVYQVQAEGSLMQFALNANGYLSLITKEEKGYRISVYDAKGNILKARVEESSGVYPLCSDVSDDNRYFAVSYVDTSDIKLTGRILFFYINSTDSENYADSMFAAVEKNNELPAKLGFMEGNILCVLTDSSLSGYNTSGEENWNIALTNTVSQISFGNKEEVVLALGESLSGMEGVEKNTFIAVSSKGAQKFSNQMEKEITYLYSGADGIVAGCDRNYKGFTLSGRESWTYTATMDLNSIFPLGNIQTVMIVSQESAMLADMRKIQSTENQQEDQETEPATEGENTPESTTNPTDTNTDETVPENGDTQNSEKDTAAEDQEGTADTDNTQGTTPAS